MINFRKVCKNIIRAVNYLNIVFLVLHYQVIINTLTFHFTLVSKNRKEKLRMGNENSALCPTIRRTSGFSHDELSRLEKRFRKLDIDCDGSIR